jgi:5'(3')-deoxyribonucleotidase
MRVLELNSNIDKYNKKLYNSDMADVNSKSEIYIDMDGVLVDFFQAWADLMGVKNFRDIKNIDQGLEKIRQTPSFWLNLQKTPNCENLLSLVKDIKGSYSILSSPLADDNRVEPEKRAWVKKNLVAFPPKQTIITTDKPKFAKQADNTPNILIDDFGTNIANWEAAGGIGFKHKDHKFERTAGNLKSHFQQTPNEAAGVGKITKQNTTADVKPGETKRQAAKLGFKLDSKGRPPRLR